MLTLPPGVCGLGTAVQNLGFGSEDPMSINFVVGQLCRDFLDLHGLNEQNNLTD